ncbi:MAG: hypothetical protein FWC40_05880 [Proteobacteria bacterium]|nr:hypothetical protein [Pseudomonadota bacterium]
MHIKIKALSFVTCLVLAFAGVVLGLSYNATPTSSQSQLNRFVLFRAVLDDRLIHAESSLLVKSQMLAENPSLAQELADVRSKLMVTTSDALKQQTNNSWNMRVFNLMIDWRKKVSASIKQGDAKRSEQLQAPNGHALSIAPMSDWWGRAPDLLLAFASVPLKNGEISSVLIAYAEEGRQLRAGKRFDEDIPALREVENSPNGLFGLFAWDGKMFVAVTRQVMQDDTRIGTIVVGMELSRDMVEQMATALPGHVRLIQYYAQTKPNANSPSARHRYYANAYTDAEREQIVKGTYARHDAPPDTDASLAFTDIAPGETFWGTVDGRKIAFARMRWAWDPEQETGFYIINEIREASQAMDQFRRNVLIAAGIFLIIALLGAFLLVNATVRGLTQLKYALLEAINTGHPIDFRAFAVVPGIGNANLGQYTITPCKASMDEENVESWTDLMMDFEVPPESAEICQTKANGETQASHYDESEAKTLYKTYMEARAANGITAPMDYVTFLNRLDQNAEKIRSTYKCQQVTFLVHVSDGKVVLKPKIKKDL